MNWKGGPSGGGEGDGWWVKKSQVQMKMQGKNTETKFFRAHLVGTLRKE